MENRFISKSKNLSDQDLLERIYNPERFLPEAVDAAIAEFDQRDIKDVDNTKIDKLRIDLQEKKRKEEEIKKEILIKEQQIAKDNIEKIKDDKFASFGLRLIAFLLDLIIGSIIAVIVFFVFSHLLNLLTLLGGELYFIVMSGLIIAYWWIYFTLLETSPKQATYGKRIVGLKVVDINGGKLDIWQATARFFMKSLSALILGIGFLQIIFSPKNQSLHDKLIKTYVIKC